MSDGFKLSKENIDLLNTKINNVVEQVNKRKNSASRMDELNEQINALEEERSEIRIYKEGLIDDREASQLLQSIVMEYIRDLDE